jgi:hypothetical protein
VDRDNMATLSKSNAWLTCPFFMQQTEGFDFMYFLDVNCDPPVTALMVGM